MGVLLVMQRREKKGFVTAANSGIQSASVHFYINSLLLGSVFLLSAHKTESLDGFIITVQTWFFSTAGVLLH